ncbi:MAG: 1-(5-phosphoribosyl)-5-[(5-phosphoribosylamino)methylideneamino]imidazole-4-carboxamide isomerase [Micavibrio sp.]|nr:1-(5-phosphoribosyl)-5-[(5-phosphoribosylamino)methylideneamino]imidazole-4-carboxamide isomerase [Micavibrio sp.]
MIIFPAIDMKDGQCVRLYKGDMDQATIFNDDPAAQAASFEKDGFSWIHLVDLNGAFAGKPVNADAVNAIIKAVSVPLQLGGGIRDMQTIEYWLDAGISRVILGTVATTNPQLVKDACKAYPGQVVVGIDAKEGMVAVEGWADVSTLKVTELAKQFEDAGVTAIIYTDIGRDGTLTGPDIEGTRQLARAVNIDIIASGGVSSIEDIEAISGLQEDGVIGVVVGRAIYDKKVTAAQLRDRELLCA